MRVVWSNLCLNGTKKFRYVTPVLRDVLHWLPVQHQISYKIAILARDCIHGIDPAYFGDVFAPATAAPGRISLRSVTRGYLVISRTRTKLGEQSFRISACGTRSLIRSSILLQAANILGKNWKHTCSGKPTHQPLRTIEEWTHLLTYLTCKVLASGCSSQGNIHSNLCLEGATCKD